MKKEIEIRSISTADVKIAQQALESIGFSIIEEGDCVEAYWVRMYVPPEFSQGKCVVKLKAGLLEETDTVIEW